MAISASGAVSFSDLRTEFVGGSSAISLGDLYRGGSNILSKAGDNPSVNLAASVPTSGVIDIQDFYSTAKGFKSTISSNTTNVVCNTLFGDDDAMKIPEPIIPSCEPWTDMVRLKKERDIVGFFISGHPLDKFKFEIDHVFPRR